MPKWCELIASGQKTIEVRKTQPALELPFKCYIYCTHGYYRTPKEREKSGDFWIGTPINDVSPGRYWGNGKVVGEFVCKHIDKLVHAGTSTEDVKLKLANGAFLYTPLDGSYLQSCRLSYKDLEKYSNGGNLYGWHISDLQIYGEPIKLSEFRFRDSVKGRWNEDGSRDMTVRKPPQSWCYIEEAVR